MNQRTISSSSTLLLVACATLVGCNFDADTPLDGGYGGGSPDGETPDEPDPSTGGSAMGGSPSTGGSNSGGASGCGELAPRQTYQCAGYIGEAVALGRPRAIIEPEYAAWACENDGYPWYGTGGVGTGGTGGAPATGGGEGWGEGSDDVTTEGLDSGLLDIGMGGSGWDGTGGVGLGGAGTGGDYGVGGLVGTGGFIGVGGSGGDVGVGGSGGGSVSDWCEERPWDDRLAGLSFAVGSCIDTDLSLPVRFQEPYGWYEVKVYVGSSPCERGELLAETAGFGTGTNIVELPIEVEGDGFISLEFVKSGEDYYYPSGIELELNPHPAPTLE